MLLVRLGAETRTRPRTHRPRLGLCGFGHAVLVTHVEEKFPAGCVAAHVVEPAGLVDVEVAEYDGWVPGVVVEGGQFRQFVIQCAK